MAGDLFTSLKVLLSQLQEGEKSASDLRKSVSTWARDISDLIRDKVEEEVEASVKKMGFIKRDQYLALESRVAELEKKLVKKGRTTAAKKAAPSRSISSQRKKVSPATKKSGTTAARRKNGKGVKK